MIVIPYSHVFGHYPLLACFTINLDVCVLMWVFRKMLHRQTNVTVAFSDSIQNTKGFIISNVKYNKTKTNKKTGLLKESDGSFIEGIPFLFTFFYSKHNTWVMLIASPEFNY